MRSFRDRSVENSSPGRIAALVRGTAELEPGVFRGRLTRVTVPFLVMLGANAAVGASSLGRTARAVISAPLGLGLVVSGLAGATLLLGRFVTVSPTRFRQLAALSAVLLAGIIATGAAVRLTGSGLGCPDWPTCADGSVLAASSRSARIEFGNRMVTGLVILVAALCVLAALVRRPYRTDLVRLGIVINALIFSNAIVGGAVVLFHLKTGVVIAHFLLAIASLSAGLLLFHRAGEPSSGTDFWGRDRVPNAGTRLLGLGRVTTVMLLLGIMLGTVVTGSGPHSGDPAKTERLQFGIQAAARVHSGAMWLAVASVVVLAAVAARTSGDAAGRVRRRVTWLMAAAVVQGGVGYLQYARKLPAGLVEVHVIGATIVWTLLMWVRAALTRPAA